MTREIHVNAYVKKDGTEVREHYRTIPDNNILPEQQKWDIMNNLDGIEFPTDGTFPDTIPTQRPKYPSESDNKTTDSSYKSDISGNIIKIIIIVAGLATIAAKIMEILSGKAGGDINVLKSKFDSMLLNLKKEQENSEKRTEQYLKELSNTNNQEEYKNLLKSFQIEKQKNKEQGLAIAKIQYAHDHNNYVSVIRELENYKSDFDEVVSRNIIERPLNLKGEYEDNYSIKYKKPNLISHISRQVLNMGTSVYNNIFTIPDAKSLWKASSYDFKKSKEYITTNGCVVYSVNNLPEIIQPKVIAKLISQLKVNDALGVIFSANSSISKELSKSNEIKLFLSDNFEKLIGGGVIDGTFAFNSTENLKNSYGKADIFNAYIDDNGDFNAIILDTWDFNNENNWIIKMGKNAQDAGIIRNYYTLTLIKIPFEIWFYWIINKLY